MKITDQDITEIAELLDCGMVCFYHRPTGTIEHHPDPNDSYFDPELWQETIDKIESDWDNYEQFEKMDSNQAFCVMEDFAHSLADKKFQNKILDCLSKRKPFQNFKILIDDSEYRQEWFEFKKNAYIDWLKQQIEINE